MRRDDHICDVRRRAATDPQQSRNLITTGPHAAVRNILSAGSPGLTGSTKRQNAASIC